MSHTIQSHIDPTRSHNVTPGEAKREGLSFLNLVRSLFTEVGAIVMVTFLANQMTEYWGFRQEHRVSSLIFAAAVGGVLGSFVVFHVYLREKTKEKIRW